MLTQQIFAVVVAVGREHHRVDVVLGRLVVVESDAAIVVELDEDHVAVDPVIEDVVICAPADPCDVCILRCFLTSSIFTSAYSGRMRPMYVRAIHGQGLLAAEKVVELDSLVFHLEVIPISGGEYVGRQGRSQNRLAAQREFASRPLFRS